MLESETLYRAKAIGIILMVLGHALYPDIFWRRFIYLFHMPMFYVLSGYLFNDKYLQDGKTFIIKRIKGLYVPYVKFGLAFILLHNIFCHFYLLADDGYTVKETIIRMLRNLLFIENESLLGATWFLRSLFMTAIIYYVSIRLMRLLTKNLLLCNVIVLVVAFVLGSLLHLLHISLPFWTDREVFCVSFFALGKVVQAGQFKLPSRLWLIPLLLIGLVVLNHFTIVKLHANDIGNPLLTFAAVLLGTYLVLLVAHYIKTKPLGYVGRKTLPILIWHLLLFKIVTLLMILLYGLPITTLTSFPVVYDYPYWWIAYCIIGIGGSLLLAKVPVLSK